MRTFFVFIAGMFFILIMPFVGIKNNEKVFDSIALNIKPGSISQLESGRMYIPGIVIVKFKPEYRAYLAPKAVKIDEFNRISSQFGLISIERMFPEHKPSLRKGEPDLSLIYIARFPKSSDVNIIARKLSRLESVEYAEPHYIYKPQFIPNDPYFVEQWYLRKVQLPLAWDITQGDTSIVIGIVDTGVDLDHPDLAGNIWRNWREIPNNGIDDDGNGYVDDVYGWDFGGKDNFNNERGKQDNDPSEKKAVHGTHVAGIASAVTNNSVGVAGAGFKCKIMAVKVSIDDDQNDFIWYGYEGIVYAADNGAKVINCSWGGQGGSRFEQEIVTYATLKGALVVAAAGNERTDEFSSPAGYNYVLAVASVDSNDVKADYSNFGEWVDVCAPGGVFNVDGGIFNTWYDNTYATLTGTSMATPLVSGISALVRAKFPQLLPQQVAERIRVTSDPVDDKNPNYRYQLGYGRVNAYRALTMSSPAVRFENFLFDDSLGNKDGAIDPGETVRLKGIFKNYLDPASNIIVRLETSDPYVTILSGTFTIGRLGTLEAKDNFSEPFTFQISSQTPENYTVKFVVKISAGSYSDFAYLKVLVRPTYRNMNANFITLTLNNRGNLAYDDYPSNTRGDGLTYRGGNNLLFEGAFMAGISSENLVDVARDETGNAQKRDFTPKTALLIVTPGIISVQDGYSIFTDSLSPSRVGIDVKLNSFAFSETFDDMNFVLLKYTVINKSGRDLQNLRVGLFLDFDLGSAMDNVIRFDQTGNFAYVYDADPNGEKTLAGIALISGGQQNIWFINNAGGDGFWGIYDGFTKAEKWEALSYNGVRRTSAGAGDVSVVIGTGTQMLKANDSLIFGFAVICGDSLNVLRDAVLRAKQRWDDVTNVTEPNPVIPTSFKLYQNYPNPFNSETVIKFDLPESTNVKIEIFDLAGHKVATLIDGKNYAPGTHQVKFKAENLPSGIYFYRIQADRFKAVGKMLLLK